MSKMRFIIGRSAIALTTAAVVVFILFPRGGYYPEGLWLRGPFSLLATMSSTDHEIAMVLCGLLLPPMFACIIWQNRLTWFLLAWAVCAWIGCGMYLAMQAVA